jgi:fatty acid desaturase
MLWQVVALGAVEKTSAMASLRAALHGALLNASKKSASEVPGFSGVEAVELMSGRTVSRQALQIGSWRQRLTAGHVVVVLALAAVLLLLLLLLGVGVRVGVAVGEIEEVIVLMGAVTVTLGATLVAPTKSAENHEHAEDDPHLWQWRRIRRTCAGGHP